MTNTIEQITEKLLAMFSKLDKSILPLEVIIKELGGSYQLTDIEKAIEFALDTFQIDKVLDYAAPEWNLYGGYPIWHLLKLSKEDADKLRNLKKVKLELLSLLKNQNEPKHFGEMKSEDARVILQEKGFSKEETNSLWIEDRIDHHYDFEDGKSIEWCRLIPENEKTEEYKRDEERMQAESDEKEELKMFHSIVFDLAGDILEAVKKSPEGISRKDIIKQLCMDHPDYLKEAFQIATYESEIVPITLDNGEEGYRLDPDFEYDD